MPRGFGSGSTKWIKDPAEYRLYKNKDDNIHM